MVSLYKLKDTELTPLIGLSKRYMAGGVELQYDFTEHNQTVKVINIGQKNVRILKQLREAFLACDLDIKHYSVKVETLDISALELMDPVTKNNASHIYITTLELHQVEYIIPKGIQTL